MEPVGMSGVVVIVATHVHERLTRAYDDAAGTNAYRNLGNYWDTWTPDSGAGGIVELPYSSPDGTCVDWMLWAGARGGKGCTSSGAAVKSL
ncbi:MAG: hypothetical protein RQ731_07890 [Anaerosomatales bacterium]|nr:hypothetical protein [Anaerosomatales bacterium]